MKFVAIHSCQGPAFYSSVKPEIGDRIADLFPHVTRLDGAKPNASDERVCGSCGRIWDRHTIRFEEMPQ